MSKAYYEFVQTGIANINVSEKGTNVEGAVNSLTFWGPLTTIVGNAAGIAVFPALYDATGFDIVTPPSSTLPIDITTPDYNTPVYLDGTNVPANEMYPFFQGTSSTTIGYVANSTGQFIPVGASELQLTNNGDYDWWKLVSTNPNISDPNTFTLISHHNFQMVSNANTTVQLLPYAQFTSAGNLIASRTTEMTTVTLTANIPTTINDLIQFVNDDGDINEVGVLIRNTIANTRVNVCTAWSEYYWLGI